MSLIHVHFRSLAEARNQVAPLRNACTLCERPQRPEFTNRDPDLFFQSNESITGFDRKKAFSFSVSETDLQFWCPNGKITLHDSR